jgi:hypothetical protein
VTAVAPEGWCGVGYSGPSHMRPGRAGPVLTDAPDDRSILRTAIVGVGVAAGLAFIRAEEADRGTGANAQPASFSKGSGSKSPSPRRLRRVVEGVNLARQWWKYGFEVSAETASPRRQAMPNACREGPQGPLTPQSGELLARPLGEIAERRPFENRDRGVADVLPDRTQGARDEIGAGIRVSPRGVADRRELSLKEAHNALKCNVRRRPIEAVSASGPSSRADDARRPERRHHLL